MKLLFVCSSNICRSPYCEFVFKRMCEKDPELSSHFEWIRSGAVFHQCKKLHPKARAALLSEGFSPQALDKHSPAFWRRFPERFEEADLIVGMTRWHKYFIPKKWRKKYIDLAELATGTYVPVPDPFLAKTQEKYNEVMRVLDGYLELFAQKVKSGEIK